MPRADDERREKVEGRESERRGIQEKDGGRRERKLKVIREKGEERLAGMQLRSSSHAGVKDDWTTLRKDADDGDGPQKRGAVYPMRKMRPGWRKWRGRARRRDEGERKNRESRAWDAKGDSHLPH